MRAGRALRADLSRAPRAPPVCCVCRLTPPHGRSAYGEGINERQHAHTLLHVPAIMAHEGTHTQEIDVGMGCTGLWSSAQAQDQIA